MPTRITYGNHGDSLQGSPEKRLDVAPDGTLYAAIVDTDDCRDGYLKFFQSVNGGSTWSYVSRSDLDLEQTTAVPSFFVDSDGYAHVSWVTWGCDPQYVIYARGTPRSGGGWSWKTKWIKPALGRMGVDSDIVAFRQGSGWVAWISWNTHSGGHTSRVRISASGTLTVEATTSGPASGSSGYQPGAMEFVHTGDGRTPATAPSILYTNFMQGSSGPIRLNRALYSGGSWTWESPVQAVASVNISKTTLVQAFDGTRLIVAYSGSGSSTVSCLQWVPGAGSVTSINPPGAPGGTGEVLGISMSIDPLTNDIYLAYYDITNGNIRWSRYNRTAGTWSAWAVAITRSPSSADGKVQLVRHPPRDSVDMIYATGSGSSWQIYSHQLTALVRAPTAPTLLDPPSGALRNLAAGYTFTWKYNPVSPGDTQQGWFFRRKAGAGSAEYWNAASGTWGASEILNTGSGASASFPPGTWASGTSFTWSVKTRSATGLDSPWAADRTVVATSAPVVTVTGPVGIVYGESTPLITWDYSGIDAQLSYQAAVFTELQASIPGFNPASSPAAWRGDVTSSAIARSARVDTPLDDRVGFRAYVRCTSAIGVASEWGYESFVISINPPAGPIVELREEIKYETEVPRVRLDVTGQSNFMDQMQAIGTEGWDAETNVTVAAEVDDPQNQLSRSLRMTSNAAGLISAQSAVGSPPLAPIGEEQPLGPLSWPVVGGSPYTALASFKAAATARAARVAIRWYDADDGTGNLIEETTGDQVVTGSTMFEAAHATALAPPGAKLARVAVQVLGATAAGEAFWATGLSFAPGRSLTWSAGGYATTQTVRVERSLDGGSTWKLAADRVKTSLYQRAIAYDREMPYRVDAKYRAATVVDLGFSSIVSGWSLISTIKIVHDLWSIRDPDDDVGELNAIVTEFTEHDDESSSVHRPAGREYPVIDTEGYRASEGTMTVFVGSGKLDKAKGVLTRTVPMIVQSPAGRVMWVRFPNRDYDVEALRHRLVKIKFYSIGAV